MLENVKNEFKSRDRAISVLSKDGLFRAVFVKNNNTINTAKQNHNLNLYPAIMLSKTLTATTMMSMFLKGEERIIADINMNNKITKIYAEVLHTGECRGFVKENTNNNPNNNSNNCDTPLLKVSRILYNHITPIIGIVPLNNFDIEDAFNSYFLQSEQTQSFIILNTYADNSQIINSNGILIQAMPNATQSQIDNIKNQMLNIKKRNILNSIKYTISPEIDESLSELLPFNFDIIKNRQIDFYCRCSKENFKNKLITLGIEEIKDMENKGHSELICQFCSKKHHLSSADFKDIINQIIASSN